MKPPRVRITPPEHESDRYLIAIHTEALSGSEMEIIYREPRVSARLDDVDLLIDQATFDAKAPAWLPTDADEVFIKSLMKPVYEPGKMASWVAPPLKGINGLPDQFEYVKV